MKLVKDFLKGLLPRHRIEQLKRLEKRLSLSWTRVLARSTPLRRFHYLFFSTAFDREAYAVVVGHLRHQENQSGMEPVNYFLRRAVHRLEKGLIMQPRREVFALDYIADTVDSYAASLAGTVDRDEVCWAHDVLTEYFSATGQHPVISAAREKFGLLESPVSREESLRRLGMDRVPFAAGAQAPAVGERRRRGTRGPESATKTKAGRKMPAVATKAPGAPPRR